MKPVIGLILVTLVAASMARAASIQPALQGLIAQEGRLVEDFRRTDGQDLTDIASAAEIFRAKAAVLAAKYDALVQAAQGRERVLAQTEQATTLLHMSRAEPAAALAEQAAREAERLGDPATAFRDWMVAARAQDDQRRYQVAEGDYERAVTAAGAAPTPKERSDIATYRSQLQERRGEYEAALVSAYQADRYAVTEEDRYYAATALSDSFFKLANSCGERLLIDARSADAGDDGTGACRRAVVATRRWEDRAKMIARANGWTLLVAGATKSMDVAAGSPMWEGRLQISRRVVADALFQPTDPARVAVTETFWTSLPDTLGANGAPFAQLLGQIRGAQAVLGSEPDPTSLTLKADEVELNGDRAESLRLYRLAAQQLIDARRSYFDPEARGTLTEQNVDVPRDLALRLLQEGGRAEAFDLFESFRARGLSEVAAALAQPELGPRDRAWLAAVARGDAELGAAQKRLFERALGAEGAAPASMDLDRVDALRQRRDALMAEEGHRRHFEHPRASQARLGDLVAAVARERIPVLMYWSTWPLTVAWLITPGPATVRSDLRGGAAAADRVNVRSIALSEPVLQDRVQRVRASASEEGTPFDAEAARQLYLFLIAPFEESLGDGQVVIIPQGVLTDLPFEALIDTKGHFLVERLAVSYAPSATLAVAALSRPAIVPLDVAAIQDETIGSAEIGNIRAVPGMRLTVIPADTAGIGAFARLSRTAPALHVLAHGSFDDDDPLLSELKLGQPMVAADMLALDLGRTRLAVLSACEGATQYRRLSNELFGFPWALQVTGVQNAVMSRWSVPNAANAAWMPAFYAGLGIGLSPANAAARAARAMLAAGDRDPHRWAAMQVMGR